MAVYFDSMEDNGYRVETVLYNSSIEVPYHDNTLFNAKTLAESLIVAESTIGPMFIQH